MGKSSKRSAKHQIVSANELAAQVYAKNSDITKEDIAILKKQKIRVRSNAPGASSAG